MTIATTTELICFLVLSAVVVIGALGVVLLSNIVYSAVSGVGDPHPSCQVLCQE